MGPGVSETGNELKRFWLTHTFFLLGSYCRPSDGAFNSLYLCAGGVVPTAAGGDPAAPAGLPVFGQCVEKLRIKASCNEAREIQQCVCTLGGIVPWGRGPGHGVPALGRPPPLQPPLPPPTGVPVSTDTQTWRAYVPDYSPSSLCPQLLKTLGIGLAGKEGGATR